MDSLDVEFIIYVTLIVTFLTIIQNVASYHLLRLRIRKLTKKIDTTMEDATKFNSETHKTHFITIMKDIYKIDLITWGRASIADNTNSNFKTVRLLKMPHVGCCNHKFNLDMESMIEKKYN